MGWKTNILGYLLFGALLYDIKVNGSFQKSNTGRVLKDSGALQYANIAWEETKVLCSHSAKWAGKNIPVYYNETRVFLGPYLVLAQELGQIAINSGHRVAHDVSDYMAYKKPEFDAWVAETLPVIKDTLNNSIVTTKHYLLIIKDTTMYYSDSAVTYAKKNIFVGSLSPDNIRRATLEALNTTQTVASNTFHWVCDMFQDNSGKSGFAPNDARTRT